MNTIVQPNTSSVGAHQAKTRLPALLDRVERGEEIVITRFGRPIARLVPAADRTDEAVDAAIDGLITLRRTLSGRGVNFTDAEIRALRDEGRR
jgi:prevent-host-death family protein